MAKDARLGLAMTEELNVPLRLFPNVAEIVQEACAAYGDNAGNLVTNHVYADWATVTIQPQVPKKIIRTHQYARENFLHPN